MRQRPPAVGPDTVLINRGLLSYNHNPTSSTDCTADMRAAALVTYARTGSALVRLRGPAATDARWCAGPVLDVSYGLAVERREVIDTRDVTQSFDLGGGYSGYSQFRASLVRETAESVTVTATGTTGPAVDCDCRCLTYTAACTRSMSRTVTQYWVVSGGGYSRDGDGNVTSGWYRAAGTGDCFDPPTHVGQEAGLGTAWFGGTHPVMGSLAVGPLVEETATSAVTVAVTVCAADTPCDFGPPPEELFADSTDDTADDGDITADRDGDAMFQRPARAARVMAVRADRESLSRRAEAALPCPHRRELLQAYAGCCDPGGSVWRCANADVTNKRADGGVVLTPQRGVSIDNCRECEFRPIARE